MEPLEFQIYGSRWDDPLALLDHVDKLIIEEIDVLVASLVRTTYKGILNLDLAPFWDEELDWYASVLVQHQKTLGRVIFNVVEVG